MKKISIILSVILMPVLIQAQLAFQKLFNGNASDNCYAVQQTSDGGYILAGETNSYGAGNFDAFLVKTDSSGMISWAKTYGDTGWDWANNVRQTFDGGYVITGGTGSAGNGLDDIWVFKTNANGDISWQVTCGGTDYDNSYDVRQTSDSGFVVCGYQFDSGNSNDNSCLIRIDKDGVVQWIKTYTVGPDDDYVYSVIETSDGGFIMCGDDYHNPGDAALIIKTNGNGNIQWAKSFGGANDYWANCIIEIQAGKYVVAGQGSQPSFGNIWLAELDSNGTPLWSRTYSGPGTSMDDCFWLEETSDRGYALCGVTESFGSGKEGFLMKTDSTGDIEWAMRHGGSADDYSSMVLQTADGGYAVAANTESFIVGAAAYFIKSGSSGRSGCNEDTAAFTFTNVATPQSTISISETAVTNDLICTLSQAVLPIPDDTLCINVGTSELSGEEHILSVFPNPFHSTVSFRFDPAVEKEGRLMITIRNTLGQTVYTTSLGKGKRQFLETVDLSFLDAGIYFAEILSGNARMAIRIVKL